TKIEDAHARRRRTRIGIALACITDLPRCEARPEICGVCMILEQSDHADITSADIVDVRNWRAQ
ncbi:MAG: hypothetical protein ACKOED_11650, partial [Aestuariivirga sp.]